MKILTDVGIYFGRFSPAEIDNLIGIPNVLDDLIINDDLYLIVTEYQGLIEFYYGDTNITEIVCNNRRLRQKAELNLLKEKRRRW